MYCPQCGIESPSDQRFCRSCGANLKVIGKAVALSEAVARSDRGALSKIKEMMESVKVRHTTEEVSRALDQVNREITQGLARADFGGLLALCLGGFGLVCHDDDDEARGRACLSGMAPMSPLTLPGSLDSWAHDA